MYVSSSDLEYDAVLQGWVNYRKEFMSRGDESDKLNNIFKKYFINLRVIESIEKACKEPVMDVSPVIKITNVLNIITGFLNYYIKEKENKSNLEAD